MPNNLYKPTVHPSIVVTVFSDKTAQSVGQLVCICNLERVADRDAAFSDIVGFCLEQV